MSTFGFRLLLASALLCGACLAQASSQQATPKPPASAAQDQTTPAAKPDDVRSMDSILAALYDVISGNAGQKRDWDRMRSLFVPGARLIPTSKPSGAEVFSTHVLSVDDYITRAQPFFEKEGFFESEVARHVEQYAHISQVFSTY